VLVLAALVVVNLYVFVWDKQTSVGAIKRAADRATPTAMVPSHPLAERGAGSGSAPPPVGRPGGGERGDTGAGSPGSDGRVVGGSTPRGIDRSETGGGNPDGSAGGAGGSAPRGIDRSETGARDPDGSDGGAGSSAPRRIHGKVGRSDTLGRVLKRSGLSAAEADEVIRALSGVFDFKTMRAGQTFRIDRGPDGRVKSFELAVGKTQNVRADRGADGALVGMAAGAQPRSERDPRP
jgi:hypothetical protein